MNNIHNTNALNELHESWEKLLIDFDYLSLELEGMKNAKLALYDTIFPNEKDDEKEVRWKWMINEVEDIRNERDLLRQQVNAYKQLLDKNNIEIA